MAPRELSDALGRQLGGRWQVRPLGASGFCDTWAAQGAAGRLFVKTVAAARASVLEAEADGLRALAATATIRVPEVAWAGSAGAQALLAMEWLDLGAPDAGFGERLAHALAALHGAPCPLQPPRYGWHSDNFIGATPQVNTPSADASPASWLDFLRTRRLQALRERLGPSSQPLGEAVDAVCEALPRLLAGHLPQPRLIHGDLWQGNWGMLGDGTPALYDPAVSCADPEFELAMMELFGAPPGGFWPAYRHSASLQPGYERRRPLYQLYHLLNHAVLFGGGYAGQALRCARALLQPQR